MLTANTYIFKSGRLGFRNWEATDLESMVVINSNPEVMRYFPGIQSKEQTAEFIERMQLQFMKKGFCYFAVEILDSKEFIGFIGLSEQTYEAPFTPCIDIGWRLSDKFWGRGYATEGAKQCLDYAFGKLKLETVFSVAPAINLPSENVMKKIGMVKQMNFKHNKLKDYPLLENCVVYKKDNVISSSFSK